MRKSLWFEKARIRIWVMAVFFAWIVLSTSGCLLLLGAGAGAGGAVYVLGNLEEEMTGSVPKLQRATVAGLKDLDMPVVKDRGDKLTAEIESQTADDKTVWISINSVTRSRSKVSIRVGYIGDEARSRRIIEVIRKHV